MRARERAQPRGDRVLPGLWRLRLPLPWPGVPHGNAWAIADGDGIVLVDTGVHSETSMAELERAMADVGLRLDQVHRLIITHAHNDHWGQARTIVERTGAPMWIHPRYTTALRHLADREADLRLRLEVGRQSGVPEAALAAYAERELSSEPPFAGPVEPAGELLDGVRVDTDLGSWEVHETPGHSPSHICLHQPEQRLLISGDHLLGRIVLWFDAGDSPDPVAEYLASLDRVAGLAARLALSGHGKPFLDVPGHIDGSRRLVVGQLRGALQALADGPRTALEVASGITDGRPPGSNPAWRLPLAVCVLGHLARRGLVVSEPDGELERWRAVADFRVAVENLDTLVSR